MEIVSLVREDNGGYALTFMAKGQIYKVWLEPDLRKSVSTKLLECAVAVEARLNEQT